jgi:hypothetical protein
MKLKMFRLCRSAGEEPDASTMGDIPCKPGHFGQCGIVAMVAGLSTRRGMMSHSFWTCIFLDEAFAELKRVSGKAKEGLL